MREEGQSLMFSRMRAGRKLVSPLLLILYLLCVRHYVRCWDVVVSQADEGRLSLKKFLISWDNNNVKSNMKSFQIPVCAMSVELKEGTWREEREKEG